MEKRATITFRLSEQEKKQLEAVGAVRDMPISQLIREAVREYLNNLEEDK